MGEAEFDREKVFDALCALIENCPKLQNSSLLADLKNERKGSTHEQMSCVVILDKLYEKLFDAGWEDNSEKVHVDFDLIIRSVIGMPFSEEKSAQDPECKRKNVIIELINSPIFDMDKLDYIMRDAHSTGIGTPQVDTQRLFRNMYIRSEQDFTLVFLHRAVPALQNMVESRDALYMYVYNHHATVFSDFLYSYIFRRLAHSADSFLWLIRMSIPNVMVKRWRKIKAGRESLDTLLRNALSYHPETPLGIVPKSYLFSLEALLYQKRSDSDMICLLHDVYYDLSEYFSSGQEGAEDQVLDWDHASKGVQEKVRYMIQGKIEDKLNDIGFRANIKIPIDGLKHMFWDMSRVFTLIDKYNRREFLKPWWKTNFEFSTFMRRNFPGDLSKKLSSWICNDGDKIPQGDEFRSQLAKHVLYITENLNKKYRDTGLLLPLQDNDFFVIQRPAHFYDEGAISRINVALKRNEIVGKYEQDGSLAGEYIIDTLTKISPQKDFYEMFEKNEFYIFSRPLPKDFTSSIDRERHYRLIEDIFVHVAEKLIEEGEYAFQSRFVGDKKDMLGMEWENRSVEIRKNEQESFEKALESFVAKKGFKKVGDQQ